MEHYFHIPGPIPHMYRIPTISLFDAKTRTVYDAITVEECNRNDRVRSFLTVSRDWEYLVGAGLFVLRQSKQVLP